MENGIDLEHNNILGIAAGWLIDGTGAPVVLGLEERIGVLRPGSPAAFVAARGAPEDLPESLRDPERIFMDFTLRT